jgi:HSP20 family protein
MRRETELKVVPGEEAGRDETGSVTTGRDFPGTATSIERHLLDTLETMERFMHNSLNRALEGFPLLRSGRLFDLSDSFSVVNPAVDVYEDGKDLVVKAELPGIDKKEFNVRLLDNSLVISGEKKSVRTKEIKGYHRIERSSGSFKRTILLPEGVKTDQATASFTDGVLQLRIPKGTGETLGRQIKIE